MSSKNKRKLHTKSVSDDYQYVFRNLSQNEQSDVNTLEQIPLSDLLKLAIKEVEEIDSMGQSHCSTDIEFRLKQHLWQYILKIKSMRDSSQEDEKENIVNYGGQSNSKLDFGTISEHEEFNDIINHPRKKFKNNHSHQSISISAPNTSYLSEKDILKSLGEIYQSNHPELEEPLGNRKRKNRHSDKRQQYQQTIEYEEENTSNHQFLMNLDNYEEEIALINVNNNISNEIRCPAPDPVAMLTGLYGMERYFTSFKSEESDSNE